MKITDESLIGLGFIRTNVSKEESGNDEDYYYYTYNITEYLSLISNANIDAKDGYKVDIFDYNVGTSNLRVLTELLHILSKLN